MKKLLTAFSMAWGNFTVLPCPYKRWDSSLNNHMLTLLPVVGAALGGVWILVIRVLGAAGLPLQLQALAAVFFLFALCGFMHMDGFMDCNDAILSRRPLEERQRILKDSHVGAFAAVTLVFLVLADFASLEAILWEGGFKEPMVLEALFLIPVASRTASGNDVICCAPMGQSQYKASFREGEANHYGFIALVLLLAIFLAAFFLEGSLRPEGILPALIAWAAAKGAGRYARKWLGGMSGDIAGFEICWGELAGLVFLALQQGPLA